MQDLTALVRSALEEDVGSGDATTAATVGPDLHARGLITQKAPGVIYGLGAAELAFTLLDPGARADDLTAERTNPSRSPSSTRWTSPISCPVR